MFLLRVSHFWVLKKEGRKTTILACPTFRRDTHMLVPKRVGRWQNRFSLGSPALPGVPKKRRQTFGPGPGIDGFGFEIIPPWPKHITSQKKKITRFAAPCLYCCGPFGDHHLKWTKDKLSWLRLDLQSLPLLVNVCFPSNHAGKCQLAAGNGMPQR